MAEQANVVKQKKSWLEKLPDAMILMVILILIAVIATWFVMPGSYERYTDEATGNTLVIPGSYTQAAEKTPVSIIDFFVSIPAGVQDAAGIFVFILMIGGALGMLNATGAFNAAIASVLRKWGNSGKVIIFVFTFICGLLSTSAGWGSEFFVFIPVLIMLFMALGYDAVVAVAVTTLATTGGYAFAPINPFNVGIAQNMAGLPMFSGMAFRWVMWLVNFLLIAFFIYRYAEKVRKDPTKSLVRDIDYSDITGNAAVLEDMKMTGRHVGVLITFVCAVGFLVFASIKGMLPTWAHYSAIFFAMGIVGGIIGGLSMDRMVDEYIKGVQLLVYAAFVVGLARSIGLVLENAGIMDTLVYYLVKPIDGLQNSAYIGGIAMFWIQSFLNVIMPSNSGQALATMPILLPLGDLIGLNKQITVLAFQLGDGITTAFFPTIGVLMAGLTIARVSWARWIKFYWKLMVVQIVLAMITICIAIAINLGPF